MNYPILNTNEFESILLNKASGSWVWDTEDKKYLDCESGMWCVNLGHNHPKIVKALKKQSSEIWHRNKMFLTPTTLEAATKLLLFLPGVFDRITFLNSGSEAMEFGISFAKKVTRREKVVSLQDSYLGAFGQSKKSSFTSSTQSKLKIQYPICNEDECNCLDEHRDSVDFIFKANKENIACLVLEPIMVSGGIFKPCTKFIQYLCKRTTEEGGLIVIDEVTTGFGRTGNICGYEIFDIDPDLLVFGKAIGNGYPISAVATKAHFEEKCSPSELYYAQSHQLDPLGAAIVSSVIDTFHKEGILTKIHERITQINTVLQSLKHLWIEEIRSYGMIFAIQIKSFNSMSTDKIILKIKNKLLEKGILIGYSLQKEVIRFLPPLTITAEEIVFLEEKIKEVFDTIY
jgi:acetylornithine aminotransferase